MAVNRKLIVFFVGCLLVQMNSQTLSVNPNPFAKRCQSSFTLVTNDTVTMIVANVSGQIVLTPYSNASLLAGPYQDSLIMDNLPHGIYFVSLKLKKGGNINVKIIKTEPLGLPENTRDFVLVYPNPTTDKLSIKIEGSTKDYEIFISDCLGQNVYHMNVTSNYSEVNFSDFPEGIYFIRLEDEKRIYNTFKVFKVDK